MVGSNFWTPTYSILSLLLHQVIIAEAPLSELLGYCQRVRTLSSGRSHFSMEFLCFKQVSSQNEAQAVRNITGFDPV
jgi:Translation elongation factors (GTPases)